MLIDDGLLRREDGAWVAAGDLSEIRMPSSIQSLVAARLDRLEGDERHVIERAAVEGKTFHLGSVRALAEGPARERVGACLVSLVRKGLVRPDIASFTGEDGYAFGTSSSERSRTTPFPSGCGRSYTSGLRSGSKAGSRDGVRRAHGLSPRASRPLPRAGGPLDESREGLARRAEELLASAKARTRPR